MRVWTLVMIVVGAVSALTLLVAAAPGLLGPTSIHTQGGGAAFGCGYVAASHGSAEESQPPQVDRSFDYRAGEAIVLTFPAGQYYATLATSGGDLVFQVRKPPHDLASDATCSEKVFDARLRAYGDGSARFRVWVPEG